MYESCGKKPACLLEEMSLQNFRNTEVTDFANINMYSVRSGFVLSPLALKKSALERKLE
jgi:hypothetical protein